MAFSSFQFKCDQINHKDVDFIQLHMLDPIIAGLSNIRTDWKNELQIKTIT